MKLATELNSTTTTKKLYGGKYQDVTTYSRVDTETGISIVTRISYGKPYEKTCDQENKIQSTE